MFVTRVEVNEYDNMVTCLLNISTEKPNVTTIIVGVTNDDKMLYVALYCPMIEKSQNIMRKSISHALTTNAAYKQYELVGSTPIYISEIKYPALSEESASKMADIVVSNSFSVLKAEGLYKAAESDNEVELTFEDLE